MINEFRGKYDFLSNFYIASIKYDGISYTNNESAFQAQKITDYKEQEQFWVSSPSDAKRLGRRVNLRSDWEQVKDEIMYEIVKSKFTQNPELKQKLIDTGYEELVEGNTWNDTYWGVCRGKGKNKLGQILMRVRNELR
jgi:ribA/ribD-fused uncharacterized protein